MKVRCIRASDRPANDTPKEFIPILGQIYTVKNVEMGLEFEGCPIWYVLEETGVMLHTYKLFETVKESSIKITKVNAMSILKSKNQ